MTRFISKIMILNFFFVGELRRDGVLRSSLYGDRRPTPGSLTRLAERSLWGLRADALPSTHRHRA